MNKSIIFGGLVVIGLGLTSVPYFMGKGIKSEIDNSIKSMNNIGITIEQSTKANYLETLSEGKVVINNGVVLIENVSKKYFNDSFNKQVQIMLSKLNKYDKKEINEFLNGMEFEFKILVDNLNSKPIVDGYISKLSYILEKELQRELSKSNIDPIAEKIDSMITNQKLAFTFKDKRLSIKDIKEELSKNNDKFKFNLEGVSFGEKDTSLKTFIMNLTKRNKNEVAVNLNNVNFSYKIQDPKNQESSLKVEKISVFVKNNIDINIEDFNINSVVKIENNRAKINYSAGFEKLNLVNNTLRGMLDKTDFTINADLDAKGIEKIQGIDHTADSKRINKEFENAVENIVTNTPSINLNINFNGVTIDGQQLGSQVNADANLKLIKVNSMDEIKKFVGRNPLSLIKFLEGSFIKIVADEKATNAVSPILLSQGISPVKSKKDGFNEVLATAKNGSLYINDRKMF